jgi:hypothetical protein
MYENAQLDALESVAFLKSSWRIETMIEALIDWAVEEEPENVLVAMA